jgi:cysteinyl-tRNA synthetase
VRTVIITDTLSGERKALEPREPGKVGIYACGPTTYGPIHIGNARPYVVFMLFGRFLRRLGYEVRVVFNLTDVNDKIYAAAAEEGVPSADWASQMSEAYIHVTDRLGIGRPDSEPRATDSIPQIIELIERLIESGNAYESGGDVYFRVRSFDRYGSLSNRDPDQMDQGEEAGSDELKENQLDFALWKAQKEGEDTAWPSPWGPGRPGWHIECSAMAESELGLDFEIHGGGSDLVFPHHENEIAQSEAAAAVQGTPLARVWMHNGMIQTDEQKMSKSEGNIFDLAHALDTYGPEAVVAYLVSGHYRQPLAFSAEALEESRARVERIRNFLRGESASEEERSAAGEEAAEVSQCREAVYEALADDFNTPKALAAIFDLVTEANKRELIGAREAVTDLLELFGLESLSHDSIEPDPAALALLEERNAAREAGDYDRADEIRDRLLELGWEVRDEAGGARLVPRTDAQS